MSNVMLVDDSAVVRKVIKSAFEKAGIDILTVESGKACLEELKKGFKGVILMDVEMPEMTGWDTIKAMAAQNLMEGVRISMLTAVGTVQPSGGEENYIIDYIQKPFKSDYVVNVVKNYLQGL